MDDGTAMRGSCRASHTRISHIQYTHTHIQAGNRGRHTADDGSTAVRGSRRASNESSAAWSSVELTEEEKAEGGAGGQGRQLRGLMEQQVRCL